MRASNQLTNINYSPTAGGALTYETRTYNSLLQVTRIQAGAMDLTYNDNTGSNNGKIDHTVNNVSGETVQYLYDSLNRLSSATGSNWGDAYVYDGFGNLLQKNVTRGTAPTLTQTVNAANNHINGYSYDSNGNTLSGPTLNGTASYDFLNRVGGIVFSGGSNVAAVYGYDASNRRIYKEIWTNPGFYTEAYYLYGLDGENLGTYTPTRTSQPSMTLTLAQSRVYFLGKKLWTAEDNVGTAATGGTFFPWGEQRTGSSSEQYGFATYWQDGESSLNYAMNRYYSPTLGRFLSADPSIRSTNPRYPGSYNLYAYATNDPINHGDPLGLDPNDPPCRTDDDGVLHCAVNVTGCADGDYCTVPGYDDDDGGDSDWVPAPRPVSDSAQLLLAMQRQLTLAQYYLGKALAVALQALGTPNCAGLFGNAVTRANGFNPATILNGLVQGTSPYGSVQILNLGPTVNAVTVPSPNPFVSYSATVILNDYMGLNTSDMDSLMSGNAQFTAVTLLHELGHVYNDIRGSGGSEIEADPFGIGSDANDQLIWQNCFTVQPTK